MPTTCASAWAPGRASAALRRGPTDRWPAEPASASGAPAAGATGALIRLRMSGCGGGGSADASSWSTGASSGRAATTALTLVPTACRAASAASASAGAPAADQSAWWEATPSAWPNLGRLTTSSPARDSATSPVTFAPTRSLRTPSSAALAATAGLFFFFLPSVSGTSATGWAAATSAGEVETCRLRLSGSESRTTAGTSWPFLSLAQSATTAGRLMPPGSTASTALPARRSSTRDPTRAALSACRAGSSAAPTEGGVSQPSTAARRLASASVASESGCIWAAAARAAATPHRSARKLAHSGGRAGPAGPSAAIKPAAAAADGMPPADSASAARSSSSCLNRSGSVRPSVPRAPGGAAGAARASTDCPGASSARASDEASEMEADGAKPRSGPANPMKAPSCFTLATHPQSRRRPPPAASAVEAGQRPASTATRSDGLAESVVRPAPPSAFGWIRRTSRGGRRTPGRSAAHQSGSRARTSLSWVRGSQPCPPPSSATHTPASPPPSSFLVWASCQPATAPRTTSPTRSATAAPGGKEAAALPAAAEPVMAGLAAASSAVSMERMSLRCAGSARSTLTRTVWPAA
eukprot:scaffold13223_cov163-Isochrysis_galbana.AAC.2